MSGMWANLSFAGRDLEHDRFANQVQDRSMSWHRATLCIVITVLLWLAIWHVASCVFVMETDLTHHGSLEQPTPTP